MKKLFHLLLILFLFSCDDRKTVLPTACVAEMQLFFSKDLKCTEPGAWERHLNEAEYDGEYIYFTEIMCMTCNYAQPTVGYNCSKEKVEFGNYGALKNIRRVYDSCDNRFL